MSDTTSATSHQPPLSRRQEINGEYDSISWEARQDEYLSSVLVITKASWPQIVNDFKLFNLQPLGITPWGLGRWRFLFPTKTQAQQVVKLARYDVIPPNNSPSTRYTFLSMDSPKVNFVNRIHLSSFFVDNDFILNAFQKIGITVIFTREILRNNWKTANYVVGTDLQIPNKFIHENVKIMLIPKKQQGIVSNEHQAPAPALALNIDWSDQLEEGEVDTPPVLPKASYAQIATSPTLKNTPQMTSKQLIAASLNIRGANTTKLTALLSYIPPQTSIIALQETHCDAARSSPLSFFLQSKGWSSFWGLSPTNSCGTAILIKSSINASLTTATDRLTTVLIINPSTNTPEYWSSVYVPNNYNEKIEFLNNLHLFDPDLSSHPTHLIAGDWNITLSKTETTGLPTPKSVINAFRKFQASHALTIHPNTTHTWHHGSTSTLIDRWLSNSSPSPSRVLPFPLSDHDILLLDPPIKKTKSSWKLNVSTLSDPIFHNNLHTLIDDLTLTKTPNPIHDWLYIKLRLSSALQQGSKLVTEKRRLISPDLLAKIAADPSKRSEIPHIIQAKIEGAKIRARKAWLQSADMPSPIVYAALRDHQAKSNIPELSSPNGPITDPDKIASAASDYYQSLYSSEQVSPPDLNLLTNLPKISLKQKESLNSLLSLTEFREAVKASSNNKAPGPDGFPVEIFKLFPKLTEKLHECYIASKGLLLTKINIGKLVLLHKKGSKDTLDNYRPLTMLNTDYKIIAKTLAERLQEILPSIIHPDQTGFIRGRSIKANILDAILASQHKSPYSAALLLDLTKAFDRVNHNWLRTVMDHFNLGWIFIRQTLLTLKNATSTIELTKTSPPFKILRGVRQGCPLAPLLFVLSHEPLLHTIRNNHQIKGIQIANITLKVAGYTDDTYGFLHDAVDFSFWAETLKIYEAQSGAKINFPKSAIIPFGNKLSLSPPGDLLETRLTDRYLGIIIGHNAKQKDALDKFKTSCSKWAARKWSLFGKAALIKVYSLSKLSYIAPFLMLNKSEIDKLEQLYSNAIFGQEKGTRQKLPLTRNSLDDGGLNTLHIFSWIASALASWIPFASLHPSTRTVTLINYFLSSSPPKKNGNILQRASFYWNIANLPLDPPPSRKELYLSILHKLTPPPSPLSSKITPDPNWARELHKLNVRATIKECLWRAHQDKLKIKKTNNHRPNCPHCHTKLTSMHLIGSCQAPEAISLMWNLNHPTNFPQWILLSSPNPNTNFLAAIIKFSIWKHYAAITYGSNPSPTHWSSNAIVEWNAQNTSCK